MADITPEIIVEVCKKNGGYRQPHLNDQLYLQCRGFRKIQNLEPYVNCKALWLDQNAISEVENLSALTELATLFLQDNSIRRLNASSFQGLANLRILNLSNNHLNRLVGLESVPLLETLQIANNRFESLEALRGMICCQKLSCVDVSNNMLDRIGNPESEHDNNNDEADQEKDENDNDDDEGGEDLRADNADKDQQYLALDNAEKMVAFWKQLPELGVLYLHGNELPRRCKFYRKRMICGLPQLMYLDERPIFPDERRTTEAWGRGGNEAEDAERNAIREEKLAEMEKNVKSLIELKGAKKEARERAEKERQLRIETEMEWRNAMQIEWARERTEMDHFEYEQRAFLEQAEEKTFLQAFSPAVVKESLQIAKANEERRKLEEEVQREIDEEEKRIEQERVKHQNQLRHRHEEMKKAIEVFKQGENDDEDEENTLDRSGIPLDFVKKTEEAFLESLKPRSESEIMDDLLSAVVARASSCSSKSAASSSKSAVKQRQSQDQLLDEITSELMPSAAQLLENSAKQIVAKNNNKGNNGDDEDPSASLLMQSSSTLKYQQQQQELPNRHKSPSKSENAASPPASTGGAKKSTTQKAHWDAFLQMESRHRRR